MLHGIAASTEDWEPFVQELAPHYRCVRIDLLGFGRSPKPEWCAYTMHDHLRSIHYTLCKLRIRRPYILMGHSLGSLLASRYARMHSGAVTDLVLLSPPVYPSAASITNRRARHLTGLLLRAYRFVRTNPRLNPDTIQRFHRIMRVPPSLVKTSSTWRPFVRTLQQCIETQTIADDVAVLTIPVHVFYGDRDRVVVGYNVELLGGNHMVRVHKFRGPHDLTPQYARLVRDYLTTHIARRSRRRARNTK